jgi:hypothetical protein
MLAAATAVLSQAAAAQVRLDQIHEPGASPSTPISPAPPQPVPANVKIPEGTEVQLRLAEKLSSSENSEGDTFEVTSDQEIQLADGTVIPAGYSGRGEVTSSEKSGMLGKSGHLSVRINYLKIGATHVHLRANKGREGASGVTNTVVLTVLFGPLGLLVHGHNVVYPKGTPITAYVDEDVVIPSPVPAPPQAD